MYFSIQIGVQLSPSNVALVCPGRQLSLTCHTNESILRWSITQPGGSATYDFRDISTIGSISPLPIDVAGRSVYVYFSRQSVNPLISTLSIDSISTDLNGTRISCSSLNSSESVMTVIHVIGGKQFMSTSCRVIILYFTASFL